MGQTGSAPEIGDPNVAASENSTEPTTPLAERKTEESFQLTDEHREVLLAKTTESLNTLLNDIFMKKTSVNRTQNVDVPPMRMQNLEVCPTEPDHIEKRAKEDQPDVPIVPDVERLRNRLRSIIDDSTIDEYQALSMKVREVIEEIKADPMEEQHRRLIDQIISGVKNTLGYGVPIPNKVINEPNERPNDMETHDSSSSIKFEKPSPKTSVSPISSHLVSNQPVNTSFAHKSPRFVVKETLFLKTACGVGMYGRSSTSQPHTPIKPSKSYMELSASPYRVKDRDVPSPYSDLSQSNRNWDDIVKISHSIAPIDSTSPPKGPTIRKDSKPRHIMLASPFKHRDSVPKTADNGRFDLMAQIRGHTSKPKETSLPESDVEQEISDSKLLSLIAQICERRPSAASHIAEKSPMPTFLNPDIVITTPSPRLANKTPETVRKETLKSTSKSFSKRTSPYRSTPSKAHHSLSHSSDVSSPFGKKTPTSNVRRISANRI